MARYEVRQYLNVTFLCNPACISNSNTSHQKWHISASHSPELLEWELTKKWMKLSEDNWQSTFIKKQHMIKEIRLSVHYVATSSVLLPFQLVFHLILLISSFNLSILPPPLATSQSLTSSFLMLTLLLLSYPLLPTCYSPLLFLRLKPNLL